MKTRFENKEDFTNFKNEIRARLSKRELRHIDLAELKPSAVNILFLDKDGELHVLLTKRSTNLTHHKGQIAFPGGKFEKADGSLLETAMRETFEEAGIERGAIEHLGRFDDFVTVSGYHVACLVGVMEHPYEYKPRQGEVDECFEVPMRIFINMEYSEVESMAITNKVVNMYHYPYMGKDIWGLTARILMDFACKIITNE
ncbi:MAG: CoA pyrophosphatase [Leptospirales bacterium]|nr:CoA pyrophosphatase [Leptospirales bacterium]